jgi:hypothetical protein
MSTYVDKWGTLLTPIDPALLEVLNAHYPERCPEPTTSDRDIWIAVGQRKVVRWLNDHYERQQTGDGVSVSVRTDGAL